MRSYWFLVGYQNYVHERNPPDLHEAETWLQPPAYEQGTQQPHVSVFQVRKYRTMTELIVDAMESVKNPYKGKKLKVSLTLLIRKWCRRLWISSDL